MFQYILDWRGDVYEWFMDENRRIIYLLICSIAYFDHFFFLILYTSPDAFLRAILCFNTYWIGGAMCMNGLRMEIGE